ncbi:30S ribosomal protein S8 [bacterium]|nr:30S ribosomal protein S8 [bacterium]
MAGKPRLTGMYSSLNENIAAILKEEKYIRDDAVVADGAKRNVEVELLYNGKLPAIKGIKLYSRPGQRQYVKREAVKSVHGGLGISIVSTARGLMTNKKAHMNKVGGELICAIW